MTFRKIAPALALLAFTQLGGCGYFHSVELPEVIGAADGPVVIDGRPSRQKRYGNWRYDLSDCHFVTFPVAEEATRPARVDHLRAVLPVRMGPPGTNARIEVQRFDLYINRGWESFAQQGLSTAYNPTGSNKLYVLQVLAALVPGPRRPVPEFFGCPDSRTGEFRYNEAPFGAMPMIGYLDATVNGQSVCSSAIHVPMRPDGSKPVDAFNSRRYWEDAVRAIVDATIDAFAQAARPALGVPGPSIDCPTAAPCLPSAIDPVAH